MKWIKIEEGCEMPLYGEHIVVHGGTIEFEVGKPEENDKYAKVISQGDTFEVDPTGCYSSWVLNPTNWARVEPPEE